MADRDGKPYHRAFEVDGRIVVKIDVELAYLLGALILSTDTTNPALLAIGHQLRSFSDFQPETESQTDDE